MKILARAKINWALRCTGFLPGGYHALDMLMESVSLCDELDIRTSGVLSLSVDGKECGEENLVYRAALALKRETGRTAGADMRLTKRIPVRAGLGGGSADCAAALIGLNRLWGTNVSSERLARIGLDLGADVPFCLRGGLCRAEGRGERLTGLEPERPMEILIVMGGEGLSTRDVFVRFDGAVRNWMGDMDRAQRALLVRDIPALEAAAHNMLLAPAEELDDTPRSILSDMYAMGAEFARMSGSGSACFGVFGRNKTDLCRYFRNKYGFCEPCHTETAGIEIVGGE